jgi:ASCH domain
MPLKGGATQTMKALVVRQPFAFQISTGEKRIEWRSWRTNYREDLLIVAEKRRPRAADLPAGIEAEDLPLGVAVCITRLVDCIWNEKWQLWEWHLADIRPLKRPFPVHGRLGLFPVQLAACAL